MDLAAHQRKLLGLFRSTYQVHAEDDAYIHRVAQSRDLAEGRRNILLWRIFVLERTAVLTFQLLKQRQLLQEAMSDFITRQNISPFRETQAPAFLEPLCSHRDSLVAFVAQFELALLKVRQGDPGSYVIPWHVDPHPVLDSLIRGVPVEDDVPEGAYQILVSRELPSRFRIVAVGPEETVEEQA